MVPIQMVDLKRQYLGINQYGQSTSSKPVTNTINNVYTNSNIVNSNSNLTQLSSDRNSDAKSAALARNNKVAAEKRAADEG